MSASFDLEAIGAAFAEAAVDPSRWDDALEVAEKATGGAGALLFDINGRLPRIPHSPSAAPSFESYIGDGWIERDERYRLTQCLIQRGVTTDLDLLSPDEIDRHPYYQEFLAPFGLRWFAGVKVAAGDDLWCLSIQRSIVQGPFVPGEIRQLAALSGRLGASAALARVFGFARAEAALDAFEASRTPSLMLDCIGQVVRANHSAEKLLGTDLQVRRRQLVSLDRKSAQALERALQEILRSSDAVQTLPPVPLPRLGKRPLLAYALRLPSVSPNALAPCQVAIVIIDPDARARPADATLKACFGLTPCEARLARNLSSGERLESVADQLGIAYQTARNQLKAIFAKTETHRQAELAALLARFFSGRDTVV